MSGEMYFEKGSTVFGISYTDNLKAHFDSEDDPTVFIYVASPTLMVSIDIFCNERRLSESGTLNLLQRQLENAPIWKGLFFSQIEEPGTKNWAETHDNTHGSLQLILRCGLFHPIIPDLTHAKNVRFLQSLTVKYDFWTTRSTIYFQEFYDTFQYSLTSMMMCLEFKYPFVFSYYGKQLVKVNYKNLIRNATLLATPLDNACVPDHSEILTAVLGKLQRAILYEFNTLNVMKECDLHRWQASSCRKNIGFFSTTESRKYIKSRSVDIRPLCEVLSPDAKEDDCCQT